MTSADHQPAGFGADETSLTLDALGLKCPLPVLKTRRALGRLKVGASLVVIASDPMAAIDIPNLARETGDELVSAGEQRGVLRFVIRKRGAPT